jgi:riboflavin kinase/FMN adenylyltransferase
LRPDRFPGRICTVGEKLDRLSSSGVDQVITIEFSRSFAQQTPEEFMTTMAEGTRLEELWVGEGFALGRDRAGNVDRLREIGEALGFRVVALPRVSIGGQEVSSSAIRNRVLAGEAAAVRRALGRPFRVAGEVIHGAHFGRTIGFPTANVAPPPELVTLADGIYASHAFLPAVGQPFPAMTYVGTRPTVNPGARLVETHLLDFDGDLYGQTLAVDVLERLRADRTFPTIEAMVAQLRGDEADARAYLGSDHAASAEARLTGSSASC